MYAVILLPLILAYFGHVTAQAQTTPGGQAQTPSSSQGLDVEVAMTLARKGNTPTSFGYVTKEPNAATEEILECQGRGGSTRRRLTRRGVGTSPSRPGAPSAPSSSSSTASSSSTTWTGDCAGAPFTIDSASGTMTVTLDQIPYQISLPKDKPSDSSIGCIDTAESKTGFCAHAVFAAFRIGEIFAVVTGYACIDGWGFCALDPGLSAGRDKGEGAAE
ncbi:hypothetical protein B9Z65_4854 [Elsinoe australis]|uniref:Uncharacterized protein n=1 Tax=Elsinoe australis TaxID=40998 RepID=A0A2P8A682_9PEZI|nr:hypothetical protein B9Z65_4854 [Elsinoe australis]